MTALPGHTSVRPTSSSPDDLRRRPRLGLAAAVLGCAGALVTMVLSLLALGLSVVAVTLGIVSLGRGERPVPATVGITAGLLSAYLIVLEMFVLGA